MIFYFTVLCWAVVIVMNIKYSIMNIGSPLAVSLALLLVRALQILRKNYVSWMFCQLTILSISTWYMHFNTGNIYTFDINIMHFHWAHLWFSTLHIFTVAIDKVHLTLDSLTLWYLTHVCFGTFASSHLHLCTWCICTLKFNAWPYFAVSTWHIFSLALHKFAL